MKTESIVFKLSYPLLIAASSFVLEGCSAPVPVESNRPMAVVTKTESVPAITKPVMASLHTPVVLSSAILKKDMRMNVYLPKGYDPQQKYPVLYALHGWNSNEGSWMPGRRADVLAEGLLAAGKIKPYIIVAPSLENSWAMNTSREARTVELMTKAGPAKGQVGMYEDYFIKELIPFIEQKYSTINSREGRYLGGVSMGGYAAAMYALKYPQLFSKVGLHSPALTLPTDWLPAVRDVYYPTPTAVQEHHPQHLIAGLKADPAVEFYVDCGEQDGLFETAKAFHLALLAKGARSQFLSGPGGHGNVYTSPRIEQYLQFYGAK